MVSSKIHRIRYNQDRFIGDGLYHMERNELIGE